MELIVGIKGNVQSCRRWEEELGAVKVPHTWKGKQGVRRLGVCPIRLYTINFPHDQLQTVLSVVGCGIGYNYVLKRYPILNKGVKWLRKLLKLKPVPIPKKIIEHMQPDPIYKAVAVIPIGIKKDAFDNEGEEML